MADAAVLVTGASAGIGEALALRLAAGGARLGLVGRDVQRLDDVARRCADHGVDVATWAFDLGDLEAVGDLAARCWDRFGGVDVLVNNAAMPKRRHVLSLSDAEAEEVMRVNFHSPVKLATTLLPRMIEQGRGCVVNVSSLGGRLGILNETAYSASKFALTGWTEAAALDLWEEPVEIRLITPGAIDTAIWSRPDNDDAEFVGELEPPDTVAVAIEDAILGGPFETYSPDMSAFVEFKMADMDAFQRGTIAAMRPEV
ncbi:MAG: SDR family NAD(P)-dependent oxidoreductase [Acidobacteria bacterium]|nr:SDR family NAD(P)-dependent oxidoreductase [Acidobacteriota bacterium]